MIHISKSLLFFCLYCIQGYIHPLLPFYTCKRFPPFLSSTRCNCFKRDSILREWTLLTDEDERGKNKMWANISLCIVSYVVCYLYIYFFFISDKRQWCAIGVLLGVILIIILLFIVL